MSVETEHSETTSPAARHSHTWMEKIAAEAHQEILKLISRRDAMMVEIADLNDQIKKARSLIAVVHPNAKKPKPITTRKRETGMMSKENLSQVAAAILEYRDDEKFSCRMVHEKALGERINIANTHQAFRKFREIEFIGKAGRSSSQGRPTLWRVMDRDAFRRYMEGANASQK